MSNVSISWWSKDTVAVVTGANKGIGYEIVRLLAEKGLTVVLTARDPAKGQVAIDSLKAAGHSSVWFHQLDVLSSESTDNLAKWLKVKFGGIDILVNNAGVLRVAALTFEDAKDTVETNYFGVKRVTESLLPLLRSSAAGARIVNVTSRVGLYNRLPSESLKKIFRDQSNYSYELIDSLAAKYLEDVMSGRTDKEGWVTGGIASGKAYSESKIFLNAHAIILARSLAKSQPENHKIFLASFCPGPTITDMLTRVTDAGIQTPGIFRVKTAAEGADTGVWLALLPREELAEKNGKFFGERTEYAFGWENPPF